ncbi:DUF1616 domain-containing protein [Chloroflexota bacterium]
MRGRRLEYDLALVGILALAAVLAVLAVPLSWLRLVLGFPLLVLLPGYALVAALFPRKDVLSPVERVSLSLGLSIAATVLIGLGLGYSPWGIGLHSLLISEVLFILLMSALAWYLRGRVFPVGERFGIDPARLLSWSWRRIEWLMLGLVLVTAFFMAFIPHWDY